MDTPRTAWKWLCSALSRDAERPTLTHLSGTPERWATTDGYRLHVWRPGPAEAGLYSAAGSPVAGAGLPTYPPIDDLLARLPPAPCTVWATAPGLRAALEAALATVDTRHGLPETRRRLPARCPVIVRLTVTEDGLVIRPIQGTWASRTRRYSEGRGGPIWEWRTLDGAPELPPQPVAATADGALDEPVAANVGYLVDAIRVCDNATPVELRLRGAYDPIQLTQGWAEALVMPIKI